MCMNKRGNIFFVKSKNAQVWVETVIYTLIGLTIIGILLVATLPRIEEMKDQSLIEQAIQSLGKINEQIYETLKAPGNRRVIQQLNIGKGSLYIDGENDKLYWEIESTKMYSEEGISIRIGIVKVTTTGKGPWNVLLEVAYPNLDIKYDNQDVVKEFHESTNSYRLSLEYLGLNSNNKPIINFIEF